MPPKKVQKKKDRAYREKLLDDAEVTDKAIAESIYNGLHSDNPAERSKALDTAVKLKFDEVKKTDDKLEELPLANVKLEDLDRLANRCSYCKHKKFEPVRTGKPAEPGKTDDLESKPKVEPEGIGETVKVPELLPEIDTAIQTIANTDMSDLLESARKKLKGDKELTDAESLALEIQEEADDRDASK